MPSGWRSPSDGRTFMELAEVKRYLRRNNYSGPLDDDVTLYSVGGQAIEVYEFPPPTIAQLANQKRAELRAAHEARLNELEPENGARQRHEDQRPLIEVCRFTRDNNFFTSTFKGSAATEMSSGQKSNINDFVTAFIAKQAVVGQFNTLRGQVDSAQATYDGSAQEQSDYDTAEAAIAAVVWSNP